MVRKKSALVFPYYPEKNHKIFRIVDANLNRTSEGLRVCEDIFRFVLDDKNLQKKFKTYRHQIKVIRLRVSKRFDVITSRGVENDIGIESGESDLERGDIVEVLCANLQRVKEALRVLEEISKLFDIKVSEQFKRLRFEIYKKEKAVYIKMNK